MKEVLDAIERHLGRTLEVHQLDYYQVIGLDLFCDDSIAIRRALQEATNRWMQSETVTHPESSQLVAKLLKQAQAILSDTGKRERYNVQLRELRGSQAAQATAAADREPSPHPVFPDADPMAPFELEPTTTAVALHENRCALLEQILDPQTRLAELELLFPSLAELDENPRQSVEIGTEPTLRLPAKPRATTGVSLAEQILRRRRRKQFILSTSFLLGSLAVLGGSVWAYLQQRDRDEGKGRRSRELAMRPPSTNESPSLPAAGDLPVIRDLPAVPRDASDRTKDPAPNPDAPARNAPARNNGAGPPTADPSQMDTPPPSATPPSAPSAMEDGTNASESEEWKKLMAKTRAAIERADFETFNREIAQCLAAKTDRGRDQAARLDQLGQLYQIGFESFENAKEKLRGAAVLKIGANRISIVEKTPEKLVVFVDGKQKSYLWKDLPFGYAKALMDLELDDEKPNDVAARAVFFSISPHYRRESTAKGFIEKDIAAWFEKSVGQSEIRKDLPQALTDTYE
jgi:hypothetical protein